MLYQASTARRRREKRLSDQSDDSHATRATASLPGLEIEIVHRRSPGADVEALSINLQATPSFGAFGRFLETANPLAFWAHALQLAWLPWLSATRALTLPWNAGAALQPPESPPAAKSEK
jgi:hypothetical protein